MVSRQSITLLSSIAICLLLSSGHTVRVAHAQQAQEVRPRELADAAFRKSRQGQVLAQARDAWSVPSKWSLLSKKSIQQQHTLWNCVSRELENQARFKSAVAALKLHYALAACQMGLALQSEAEAYVLDQMDVQEELIEIGGQVDDTTVLKRALIDLRDQKLQIENQQARLRDELSLLVGPEWACSYLPEGTTCPTPDLSEQCEVESWALANRAELRALGYVRNYGNGLTEEAVALIDGFSSFPTGLKMLRGPKDPSRWLAHRPSLDQVSQREKGLDDWIRIRSDQIRIETAGAYRSKSLAVERWKLAVQKTETLSERCETLKALSDFRGNLPEQVQAGLELYRAKAQEIERWSQWHQADCELQDAIGRIGFWNAESSPSVPSKTPLR